MPFRFVFASACRISSLIGKGAYIRSVDSVVTRLSTYRPVLYKPAVLERLIRTD